MDYKLIENSRIPSLLSFFIYISAITIGKYIFARGKIGEKTLRHELVHVAQWKETLYIGFLFYYIKDWFIGLIKYKNLYEAYRSIRMESEARLAEDDIHYLDNRKSFHWKNIKE
tara:strand:- start:72 stop:413 length:342 start_codon:yes stop_codon:yes gene_type:complete